MSDEEERYYVFNAYLSITVKARDEDEAYDRAADFYLCAQCSGWGREYGAEASLDGVTPEVIE